MKVWRAFYLIVEGSFPVPIKELESQASGAAEVSFKWREGRDGLRRITKDYDNTNTSGLYWRNDGIQKETPPHPSISLTYCNVKILLHFVKKVGV